MPRHDYRCPECGWRLYDQERSFAEGGQATAPQCFECDTLMVWTPTRFRTDLRTDGEGASGHTFQKFVCRDGLNNLIEIDSLHTLRKVERESEKMAADGIGQPIRFRGFAQDHSNMNDNTFGAPPSEQPSAEGKRKFGLRNGATQLAGGEGGSDPECAYGPGVNDSNTSALIQSGEL